MKGAADRLLNGSTVAKWLLLTAVCGTSALNLWAPSSLTARSALGELGQDISGAMLLLSCVGWLDIVWNDLMGRLIMPNIRASVRHRLCVLYYSTMTSMYGAFAFAATDRHAPASWVLFAIYAMTFLGGVGLTVTIAREDRPEMVVKPRRRKTDRSEGSEQPRRHDDDVRLA